MATSFWQQVTAVVPFRLASRRFPDKALASYRGRTLLEHALDHAAQLGGPVVLTGPADDLARVHQTLPIPAAVQQVESSEHCRSATERLVEIHGQLPGAVLLSLPVDEPELQPAALHAAVRDESAFGEAGALTFYCPFVEEADLRTPLSAKVVLDRHGRMLYMSRREIPARKDGSTAAMDALKKNVGAFLFQRSFLETLREHANLETHLDRVEGLEQLRWLELGLAVQCVPIAHRGFGIDVEDQLAALEQRCPP